MLASIYNHFLKSTGVSTDTRKTSEGNLFFALKGPSFNGNKYASVAIANGASYAIVDEPEFVVSSQYLLVEDVLTCLQDLAHYHRQQLQIPIIAVTGSNGKTTTKELLHGVLSTHYKTFSTQGNLNNHIGVPLTLLSIDRSIEMAVIELGANHIGEIELLCKIAAPSHGFITNIGLDHLEGYGSIEGVAQGSSELFYYLLHHQGVAFVNSADPLLMRMATRLPQVITYPAKGDFYHCYLSKNDFYLEITTEKMEVIKTHLTGAYNLDNIATALCIGKYFEVPSLKANEAIAAYIPQNMRSQVIAKDSNKIILDAYNANPSSMEVAIENLSAIKAAHKVVVLGDMFEMGDQSAYEHARIANLAMSKGFQHIILIGKAFSSLALQGDGLTQLETKLQAIAWLQQHPFKDTVFLLKGSRGMALEQLVEYI